MHLNKSNPYPTSCQHVKCSNLICHMHSKLFTFYLCTGLLFPAEGAELRSQWNATGREQCQDISGEFSLNSICLIFLCLWLGFHLWVPLSVWGNTSHLATPESIAVHFIYDLIFILIYLPYLFPHYHIICGSSALIAMHYSEIIISQ